MAASTLGYTLAATINLPGTVGGHGDWVAFDPTNNTVWLAQSPDNNVVVIDAATNTVAATIHNIGNANGIALTAQYAFVADVTNDKLVVIDKTTDAVVASVAVPGTTPDGVTYISSTNEIAVASDDANMEYFYNATTFALTASLQLLPNPSAAGPDVAVYVASKDLLYQPDNGVMDVINPHTHAIVTTWNLLSTGSVKPAAYDPVTNTFVVGTTNKQALIVNADTGAIKSTITIPGSVDEVGVDVNARLAYLADKSGVVDLVNLDSGTLVGQLPTQANAHTLAVDTNNHAVYAYEYNNTVDVFNAPAITADTVYRFFDKTNGSHFFTSSQTEANSIIANRPDLVQETNGFGAVGSTSTDSNAAGIFRFFDTNTGTHFYTASASERDSVIASRPDLKFEGTAFNEDTTLQAGDRAVYRFFDQHNGTHFFTADATEQASLSATGSGFTAEGVAFYAPSTINVS